MANIAVVMRLHRAATLLDSSTLLLTIRTLWSEGVLDDVPSLTFSLRRTPRIWIAQLLRPLRENVYTTRVMNLNSAVNSVAATPTLQLGFQIQNYTIT